MKVLYVPQPSMRSYKTGKWHLESSSMMIRMRSVVYHLPSSFEWSWVVPRPSQRSEDSEAVVPYETVTFEMPWQENVGKQRWDSPLSEWVPLLQEAKPDVIMCETVEYVAMLRQASKMANVKPKIISLIGYVPFHTFGFDTWPDPMWRQIEGYWHSDKVVFNSEEEKDRWYDVADEYAPGMTAQRHMSTVWHGLFDPDDASDQRELGRELRYDDGIPTLFYAGRLSDDERTNYSKLISALEILKREMDFRVWVGNPNEAMSWATVERSIPNYEQHFYGQRPLARSEYLRLLWAADVVPLLIPNRTAGFCEAAYAENVILCADKIAEKKETILRVPSTFSGNVIAPMLKQALNLSQQEEFRKQLKGQQRWVTKHHAVHRNITEIRETFEQAVGA